MGLKPATPGLEGRCPIYWATETQHSGPDFSTQLFQLLISLSTLNQCNHQQNVKRKNWKQFAMHTAKTRR